MRSKARSRRGHQEAASASHGPAGTNFCRAPASEIRFWKDFPYWHGDFPIHEKYENPAVIDDFLANHVFFLQYVIWPSTNGTWPNGTIKGHCQATGKDAPKLSVQGSPEVDFFLGFDRLNKHQIVGNNYKKKTIPKEYIYINIWLYMYILFFRFSSIFDLQCYFLTTFVQSKKNMLLAAFQIEAYARFQGL